MKKKVAPKKKTRQRNPRRKRPNPAANIATLNSKADQEAPPKPGAKVAEALVGGLLVAAALACGFKVSWVAPSQPPRQDLSGEPFIDVEGKTE